MEPLNLPPYERKLKREDGKLFIFDNLRRRFVALTPEEWVRQHFVHYLTDHLGYPPTLLANEVELQLGTKKLRCDSVLYTQTLTPKMIVEYKAPNVALTKRVFDQISDYNLLLRVDYLIVSNGLRHICCKMDYEHHSYSFLETIPRYENL
ncbi:MAG: type I restriction enzyme HsdR N-terminal domain-containing protein [Prevotella sp.]|nr:type I restriction enzyme HsdR N-terminal domain-containing protein [Prevotella sp.]